MKKEVYSALMTLLFAGSLLTTGPSGCGSSAADAGAGAADDGGGSSSALSVVFPTDLAVASPTASSSPAVGLKMKSGLDASADFLTKKAALADLLSGTATTAADCAFTLNLTTNSTNASCYGPTLKYANHPNLDPLVGPGDPNTTDDDAGFNDTDGDGTLPPGDLGIWQANEGATTQACSAAQMNAKVGNIASQVDSATLAMASIVCLAGVDGTALPAAGSSIDMTTSVSTGFTANGVGLTVSNAALAREADDADGNAVYLMSLEGTATTGAETETVSMRLKHVSTATDNSTYKGKLSYTVTHPKIDSQGCGMGGAGSTDATSISYEKASATDMTYQLQSGVFCGSTAADAADVYTSATDYTVSPAKTWGGNFNVALFNFDPADNTGNFEFAWQAGNGDGNTRVMNISLASTAGVVSGDAFFGFGPSVQTGAGAIDRMICNWAGPGNSHTGVSKAQQQAISFDSTSGLFQADTSNITYAPTTTCDMTVASGKGGNFSYTADGVLGDGGSDVTTDVTNNLVDLTAVSAAFTAPTSPADVD